MAIWEEIAQKLNYPPHNVVPNDKIKLLAEDPAYLNSLQFAKGMNRDILNLLKRKLKAADSG